MVLRTVSLVDGKSFFHDIYLGKIKIEHVYNTTYARVFQAYAFIVTRLGALNFKRRAALPIPADQIIQSYG